MDKIAIRIATMEEIPLLEELQRRASLNNPGDREALLAHPEAIQLPKEQVASGNVFVAEIDAVRVGFAAIVRREDGDMELDGLFVEPMFWRRGIGRVLVERCVVATADAGASALRVIGNPHAESFYLSAGFITLGTEQTQFGIGLLMTKSVR